MSDRKRYALVGAGGRAVMFLDAIADRFKDSSELVGLCDVSRVRMDWHNRRLGESFGTDPIPTYHADDFDRMVAEQKPDTIIVTTMDSLHHEYIVRAMDLGCDAITEKPMTIDAEKARQIMDAIDRTGRHLRVTFNYRFAPHVTKVKELVSTGVIGRPLAVDFAWMLDTRHGADYFRRWHARLENSGGLLVHKATHHFDLINWWIDSFPQTVFAMGDLKFYGRKNAEARGERYDYERYTGVEQASDDPFGLSLTGTSQGDQGPFGQSTLKGLYYDAEQETGYIRDRNVFGDHINIYDTMALLARYDNQVTLNYSLIAYSPWEGYRVAITGEKGRLEIFDRHGSHIIAGQSDEELAASQHAGTQQSITVFPMFEKPYDVSWQSGKGGGHGGADPILLEQIFSPDPPEDRFGRNASYLDGAASLILGVSANESIRSGQPVRCRDLLELPTADAAHAESAAPT